MFLDYDTLDNVDTSSTRTPGDLYDLVLGRAMEAVDLCGVLSSAPLDQSPTKSAQWGGAGVTFGDPCEVWHVRSAPRGRIGQPLVPNEVRQVSVLIRQGSAHRGTRITNIKLWKLPESAKLEAVGKDLREAQEMRHCLRGSLTFGAMGVAIHGINLFESRAQESSTFLESHGCHSMLSAIATISSEKDGAICKIESSTTPHYVVAAALAGFTMNDAPCPRSCQERYTERCGTRRANITPSVSNAWSLIRLT